VSRRTELSPEQRTWVNDRFVVAVESGIADGAKSTTVALRDAVLPVIRKEAGDGDKVAEDVLTRLESDGLFERATDFLDSDTGVIVFRANGGRPKRLRTPTRVGIRRRTDEAKVFTQQRFWWEVTWEDYYQFRDGILAVLERLNMKKLAFAEVDKLHVRYPDTKSPGEACDHAGIDPREFELHNLVAGT